MSRHARYLVQRLDVTRPHYWAGDTTWTTNPAEAIRFYSRYEAAEAWTLDHARQDGGIDIVVCNAATLLPLPE